MSEYDCFCQWVYTPLSQNPVWIPSQSFWIKLPKYNEIASNVTLLHSLRNIWEKLWVVAGNAARAVTKKINANLSCTLLQWKHWMGQYGNKQHSSLYRFKWEADMNTETWKKINNGQCLSGPTSLAFPMVGGPYLSDTPDLHRWEQIHSISCSTGIFWLFDQQDWSQFHSRKLPQMQSWLRALRHSHFEDHSNLHS